MENLDFFVLFIKGTQLLLIEDSGADGGISFARLVCSARRSAAVFTSIGRAFEACFIDGLGFVPSGLAFVGWWTYLQEVFLSLITVILVSL